MFEAPRQISSAVAGTANTNVAVGLAPLADLDFRKIAGTIWRGKTTILATTVGALALAFLYIVLAPHQYTATTQILIQPTDLRAVANDLTQPNQVSDAALMQVESQVRVITSDNVLRRVVQSEGLDRDPEFARDQSPFRAVLDDVMATLGLGRSQVTADKTLAALSELKRHIQVIRPERTYIVNVSVTSKDPEKAARIANAIAQAYLTDQTQVRADAANQISQSLTARLKELKDRVRESEERVEAFKARNNIVDANGQALSDQQLSDMNNQLAVARARTADAKARIDQVEVVQKSKGQIGAFPQAVQSATITALRSQYAEIVRREAEQMTTLGPRHPAVIEIEAQADRLQRNIEDEVNRIAASARTEYESAKTNEDLITASVNALKHNTVATNEAMVGLRELERDVQASRAVYESFLVRARETGEQATVDTKNIQIISRADLPLRRSSPPSNLLIALGAMALGMAAGTGLTLVRAPVGGATAPRGGETPRLEPRRVKRDRAFALSPAVPVLAVLPGVDIAFGLDAMEDPTSRFATEIQKVYEAIRADDEDRNPSVLIVAAHDDDDAAAVALTLAALAAATQRVLLIDADLDHRTLAAIDADQSEAGLVDVAVGRRTLSDIIVRDRQTNVDMMSFVSASSRRARRISDDDVRQAFDQTKRFDMVIVAAMDVSRDPSARFFAGLVDHIVLVARADEAGRDAVERFVARFGLDARKVRGAVLTGAEAA